MIGPSKILDRSLVQPLKPHAVHSLLSAASLPVLLAMGFPSLAGEGERTWSASTGRCCVIPPGLRRSHRPGRPLHIVAKRNRRSRSPEYALTDARRGTRDFAAPRSLLAATSDGWLCARRTAEALCCSVSPQNLSLDGANCAQFGQEFGEQESAAHDPLAPAEHAQARRHARLLDLDRRHAGLPEQADRGRQPVCRKQTMADLAKQGSERRQPAHREGG